MKKCTNFWSINLLWSLLLACLTGSLNAQAIMSFDLFLLDVKTGEMEQLTFLPEVWVFNPSFSNNGKYIVADGFIPDQGTGLGIVDVKTSEVWGLEGGEGGNDASWSPNGEWIVFDGLGMGIPNLYLLPPEGGIPMMIREFGIDAEWAPDSEWIVFKDIMTDELKTMNVFTGDEYFVHPFGYNPTWSPNGKYIAFHADNDIFIIEVDETGTPLNMPVQLTDEGPEVFCGQPTWSNNSKTIYFHSNMGDDPSDPDIWAVPAEGGTPVHLGGHDGPPDYDPCASKNGRHIAFSSMTFYAPPPPMPGNQAITNGSEEAVFESYPNPFSEEISIRIKVNGRSHVALQVYDANGALVRILADAELSSGIHRIRWDGTNEGGMQMPNGVYFCHFFSGDRAFTQRIALIK